MKRAVRLAAPARRPHVIMNEGVDHWVLLAAQAARRSSFAIRVLVILDGGDLLPRRAIAQ